MFVIVLEYIKPLEVIEELLEEHIIFLNKYYEMEKFICSGRQNPRVGGLILAKASSKQELEKIIEEDPFYINKAAEYKIIEFVPTKCDTRFSCFID